ncbi:uncharacterized protein LOC141634537 [Silene latifolia]|uniref:uncharacterized protein LOC141634537 n=1 Tax=Silene latifolia TaxID=37657 RepID=UPI003D774C5A
MPKRNIGEPLSFLREALCQLGALEAAEELLGRARLSEFLLIPMGPRNSDLYIPQDPPELLVLVTSKKRNKGVEGSEDVPMEEADGSGKPGTDEDEEADDCDGTGGGVLEAIGDAIWRSHVEFELEELRDEIESVHDQNRESLALQRAMSDMFKDMYPES